MSRMKLIMTGILVTFLQVTYAGDGGIGIKAGANFSKSGFIAEDTKFQPGLTMGLTYEKKAAKIFAFEIGILYHWKRSESDGIEIGDITYENFKNAFHFLEIPVVLKFSILSWLNVNAGPYVSYLIAASGESGPNIWNLISDDEFRDENGEAFLNRLDFGFHIGTEFTTKTGFGFGARYSQGFGDITNNDFEWNNLNPADSENVRTSSLFGYIFYQF